MSLSASLAQPGQGVAGARTVGSVIWVVHWGLRHARSERRRRCWRNWRRNGLLDALENVTSGGGL